MHTHSVSPELFNQLSAGLGGPTAVGVLRHSEHSRTLHILRHICTHWPGDRRGRDGAVGALARAQAEQPEVVARLLTEPHTNAWAVLAALLTRSADIDRSATPVELSYLAGLAAVAAMRAGIDARIATAAGPDGVFLPGVGNWRGKTRPGDAVELRVGSHGVSAMTAGSTMSTTDPSFEPVRRLLVEHAGLRLEVSFDDLDPFRDGYHVAPSPRLPDDVVARWHNTLSEAWPLLVRHCPERAAELAAGVRAFVPLAVKGRGVADSATSANAFGAVGLTMPDSAADLAVTLVHEFQHSKLSSLMRLVPLHQPQHQGRYFAPWRTDARPIGGLIHGVYSFLAVADVWQRFRREPAMSDLALRRFVQARVEVSAALGQIERADALTAQGRQFLLGLYACLRALDEHVVPVGVVADATRALNQLRADWEKTQQLHRHSVFPDRAR